MHSPPSHTPTQPTEEDQRASDSGDASVQSSPTRVSFGRYVVLRVLGEGGMGIVYEAFDPVLDRRVAVKVLTDSPNQSSAGDGDTAQRDAAIARLLREGKALAQLSHPNVLTVLDAGVLDGLPFIAMELIRGQTLADWWRQDKRSWSTILRTVLDAGEGLWAAHRAGLVHRDFKPANVIVGDDACVRVIDFGLVRSAAQTAAPHASTQSERHPEADIEAHAFPELTREGDVVGTPAYMAPEQFAGRLADERSDQYAFCATLYEGLFGQRPPARKKWAQSRACSLETIEKLCARRKLPPELAPLLSRGLNLEPDHRHASLGELLVALRTLIEIRTRPRRRVRNAAISSLAAVALTLLVYDLRASVADPCPSPEGRWQGVWDSTRQLELGLAFTATGTAHAGGTWQRVEDQLERYTEDWNEQFQDNCQITRIDRQRSDFDMDLAAACLQRNFRQFSSLLEVFASVDTELVRRSIDVVEGLPSSRVCNDIDQLRQRRLTSTQPQLRQKVEAMREKQAEVIAWESTGRYVAAMARLERMQDEVFALDYAPLIAEYEYTAGTLQRRLGQTQAAIEHHQRTLVAAIRSDYARLSAEATLQLVFERGYLARDFAAGGQLLDDATARVAAAGDPAPLRGVLSQYRGVMAGLSGDHVGSEHHFRTSLAIYEDIFGVHSAPYLRTLTNVASATFFQGRYAEALDLYAANIEGTIEAVGPDHPKLSIIYRNHAATAAELGRFELTHHSLVRALSICADNQGQGHASCELYRLRLAEVARILGDTIEAQQVLAPVFVGQAERGFPSGVNDGWAEAEAAAIALARGEADKALGYALTNLQHIEADESTTSYEHTLGLRKVAHAYRGLGQLGELRQLLERARAGWAHAVLSYPGDRAWIDLDWAFAVAESDELDEALPTAHAAIEQLRAVYGLDNPNLCRVELALARWQAKADPGMAADSIASAQAQLQIYQGAIGRRSHVLIPFHATLGQLWLERRDIDPQRAAQAAADAFADCLALNEPGEHHPSLLAECSFGQARALWRQFPDDARQRRAAIESAKHAKTLYRSMHGGTSSAARAGVARVEAWLRVRATVRR